MDAVSLLEANWISLREILEMVRRVLSRFFTILWPKKKVTAVEGNLAELAKSFDTADDPLLQFKGLSIKRGVEGAITFSLAHRTDFDWEKAATPHGRTRDEMKVVIEKAKKFAPALSRMISPSVTSAAPTSPSSVVKGAVPHSASSQSTDAPPPAAEPNTEVA
jgi:hypothetical protein